MKAIVCGAGIAGLTTAIALRSSGWEVEVLERAPALRDGGYVMDVFGPGYDALERMGLLPALRRAHQPIHGLTYVNAAGGALARLDYEVLEVVLGGRVASVLRGDLVRLLHDALPATVLLRYDTTVEAVRHTAGSVGVLGSDGVEREVDLLVGADGLRSRVRRLAFGPDGRYIVPLGYHSAAYLLRDVDVHARLAGRFLTREARGAQAGAYPLADGRVATFFAHADRRTELPADPVEELRARYGGLGWLVPELLAPAGSAQVYYDLVAQTNLPTWSSGRVVLVGDAGHAVSLFAGQGGSLAVAAGEALGAHLDGRCPVLEALARHEAQLRPLVEATQRRARRTAPWFVPASTLRMAARRGGLRTLSAPGVPSLMRRLAVGVTAARGTTGPAKVSPWCPARGSRTDMGVR